VKVFVSYSFRQENGWIKDYVIPLIRCFGHEAVTGDVLGGAPLPDEVHKLIRTCRRAMCFMTQHQKVTASDGSITYAPPDWVRDEMTVARTTGLETIEFRERLVTYEGAASFVAFNEFDRQELPKLLLRVAEHLKRWPVGPLQLRLRVQPELLSEFSQGVVSGGFEAICAARDGSGTVVYSEKLPVRIWDGQFVVPFWIKPDPDVVIDLEIKYGPRKLVCQGVSPTICIADLRSV
jgi:hypothetical protein